MAQGVRVVVADDTPDIRALLRLILGKAGYDIVAEAADGAQAVALAAQHQPDVILVDLAMPVMDGLEAIPQIRAQAPDTKVVVFSGFKGDVIEAEALAAGAHAVIEKGSAPPEMLAALAAAVSGQSVAPVATEEARPADRVEEDLSFVLHELMGPITVIEGFAELLASRGDSLEPSAVRDYGARIARGAAQLRSLIQAVADARRVEGGSLRIEPELVDVGVLVPELVADLASVTAPHPVVVDAEAGFVVNADAMRIRQVVTNLVSNAAKFSPPESPIEVAVGSTGGVVEVSVADHGPGVPPERVGDLFSRFSRLGQAAPGMGIGLYISRGIARAHGGDVRLVPGRPGEGARFVLSLPSAEGA